MRVPTPTLNDLGGQLLGIRRFIYSGLNAARLALIVLGLCTGIQNVSWAAPLLIESPHSQIDITPQLTKLLPTENDISPEDALLRLDSAITQTSSGQPYYLINRSDLTYWFYGEFQMPDDFQPQLIRINVDHPYPQLDFVDLYQMENGAVINHYRNGINLPLSERQTKSRLLSFEVPLQQSQTFKFLVKVQSQAKQPFRLSVQSVSSYATHTAEYELVWGLFFGVFVIAAVINLLMYFAIKDKVYLLYVAFVCANGITQASLSNHASYILWPEAPNWNEGSNLFFLGFAGIAGVLFTQSFLKLKTHAPQLNGFFAILLPLLGMITVLSQTVRYEAAVLYSDIVMGLTTLMTISAGVVAYRAGVQSARFFLLGWGLLSVCVIVYILMMRSIIPVNLLTLFSLQLGCVAEIIILTIALGDKIRFDEQERKLTFQDQKDTLRRLKEAESRLIHRALHDTNSGLPNRQMLVNRIAQAITSPSNYEKIYLSLIKIKGLREINNTLGHFIGDKVAHEVSNHIIKLISKMDSQVHIDLSEGEGEFLAVTQGMTFTFIFYSPNDQTATSLLGNLLGNLPQQISLDGLALDTSTCSGLSGMAKKECNPELLIRNAFVAIELAEKNNQSCQLYTEAVNPYSERRLTLISDLKKALENNELEVYLQPQLDTKNQCVISAEALLRWKHPTLGPIRPDEFIEIAENSGAITELTRWVIRHSIAALASLHEDKQFIGLSINISAKNMHEIDLTEFIVRNLAQAHISPEYITLEITETAMMQNPSEIHYRLSQWNELGLATSIDDFGTGYSSLSHLKKYPMRELKIDRSFVKDMAINDDDLMIVRSTLDISHNMRMRVVAEGVEDEHLLSMLSDMGCDIIQGYLLTPPLPLNEFKLWLSHCKYKVGYPTPFGVSRIH